MYLPRIEKKNVDMRAVHNVKYASPLLTDLQEQFYSTTVFICTLLLFTHCLKKKFYPILSRHKCHSTHYFGSNIHIMQKQQRVIS